MCPCVAKKHVEFRGIFLGRLHFEQNLWRSGEWEVCCPFPCVSGCSDSHVTCLLPSPVSVQVSGSPSVTTAQSIRTFRPALTLLLQVICEGLDAAVQVCHLSAVGCRQRMRPEIGAWSPQAQGPRGHDKRHSRWPLWPAKAGS